MGNPEHLEILKQGVDFWNNWRDENPSEIPDLSNVDFNLTFHEENIFNGAEFSRANLRNSKFKKKSIDEVGLNYADLRGAEFYKSTLYEVDFTNADLRKAKFRESKLVGVNLSHVDLSGASLHATVLRDVNLSDSNLQGVDFSMAILSEVDLSRADISDAETAWTIFAQTKFDETNGLDKVFHSAESSIGIDTVYLSKGNIPVKFLRGAGIPDNFIEYTSSLNVKAFEYYSCFISYSGKDENFAKRLFSDLQNEGVRCWFAPEDMKIGDKIRQRIDETISIHDKLLLVLSENSVNSKWVEKEIETAFEKESQDKTVLFPIRLDNTAMETDQAWAADIRRTRHIGDFTNWKDHNSYIKAFDRLLRDLKSES